MGRLDRGIGIMPLIIETGSIVPNADSYVTRAEYITYAASLGVIVADNEDTDVKLRKSKIFIDSHEDNLKGVRVQRDQSSAYPRVGVVIDNWHWNSDEIPRQVILAQLNITLDIEAGIDPYNPPVNPNRATIAERVEGAVSVQYANSGGVQKLGRSSAATALMSSLLKRNGLSIALERS